MKYRITLELEMETEDEPSSEFIRYDLEQEINCASYSYKINNFTCITDELTK